MAKTRVLDTPRERQERQEKPEDTRDEKKKNLFISDAVLEKRGLANSWMPNRRAE